ncbi:MAG: hypothetical protein ABI690_13320 [Chloroflexota bacterium]
MKFRLLLPGILALVLFAAACTPPNLRNEKFLRDDSLFTIDENCITPCWNGITPGTTKWSDALTIIEDTANYEKPTTQNAESGSAIGAMWKEKGGDDCCQIVTTDGQSVNWILLQLAPDHTLKELIDTRGEPAYVVGTAGNDEQAIMNLFYPDQGLVVFVFVAGAKDGKLSDTSEVVGAYYLGKESMDTILQQSSLYAWKGYDTFAAYAPDAEGANFAITPVPTAESTEEATPEATPAS